MLEVEPRRLAYLKMMTMKRLVVVVLLIIQKLTVCNSFGNLNLFRRQQFCTMPVTKDLEYFTRPNDLTKVGSTSALRSVYASPGVTDSIDERIAKFRPGPEISIGSLKLNWYGVIWGIIGVSLGFFWWAGLAFCQVFQFLTRQKFDPQWRLPVEVGHLWGTVVLRLTNCYPVVSGKENLKAIYKRDKKAEKTSPGVMFVANHSSWLDIYFVGVSIGWKNYKVRYICTVEKSSSIVRH